MTHQTKPAQTALLAVLVGALALAACGGGSAPTPSPAPTPKPTPTPIVSPVKNPADAAALVIATNALFAGALELDTNLIGASKWWVATANAGGAYTIVVTVGWGDCPAGCISRHTWTFDVGPDGTVTLASETGEPVPSVLPG